MAEMETPAHADAGPSSSNMWINCPASVTLARGRHRKATIYTREGTAAHLVSEMKKRGEAIPQTVEIEGEIVEVTPEMLDHVDAYLNVLDLMEHGSDFFAIEQRVSLDWFYEPQPMPEPVFGTADAVGYNAAERLLTVVDLKYGQGYSVDATENSQLRIYALGAIGLLDVEQAVANVRTIIIQPRASGSPVKSETLPVEELLRWANDVLRPAIKRIGDGDTTENVGDGSHCKWCVRAGECRALHARAVSVAKMAFDETQTALSVTDEPEPPAPGGLTNDELGRILEYAELISAWVSKVRAEVSQRLDAGQDVPGWKLVAKRANRKWIDEPEAMKIFISTMGTDALEPPTLLSPAKMEKVLKRYGLDKKMVDDLVTRESSGTTLVSAADERKQVMRPSLAAMFADGE